MPLNAPTIEDLIATFEEIEASKPDRLKDMELFHKIYGSSWEELLQGQLSRQVTQGPTPQRTPVIAMRLFRVEMTSEKLAKKFNALFVHHSHLNLGVKGWGLAFLAGIRLGLFDTDPSLSVDQSGTVRKFDI